MAKLLSLVNFEVQEDPDIVVKSSIEHPYLEALNYAMIRQMTTIPVPRVIQVTSCQSSDGIFCMVTERISGRTLAEAWSTLTLLGKLRVALTLRSYVARLRQLRRSVPGDLDGSISLGRYFNVVEKTVHSGLGVVGILSAMARVRVYASGGGSRTAARLWRWLIPFIAGESDLIFTLLHRLKFSQVFTRICMITSPIVAMLWSLLLRNNIMSK